MGGSEKVLGSQGVQTPCLSQACPPPGPWGVLESRIRVRDPSSIPACYQLGDSAHLHAPTLGLSFPICKRGDISWDAARVKAGNVAKLAHQSHPDGRQMEPSPQHTAQVLSTINPT